MFGQRLATLRRAAGHTQADLGRAVGAAQSTISQLEAETRRPSFEMLHELSSALGVPVAFLMQDGHDRLSLEDQEYFLEYRSLSPQARSELRRYARYLRQVTSRADPSES